jgi:hypothetical protein
MGSDALAGGTWSGSTVGTFTARRAAAEGGEETAATVPRTRRWAPRSRG